MYSLGRFTGSGELFADRFQIEEERGRSFQGVVYRAIDHETSRTVALKLLRALDEPTDRHRFERDAEALRRLDHPAIVRYVAYGHSEEREPYLAMEWLEEQSLRERLAVERKPLAIRDVVTLGLKLADALAAAHALGILHREVRPWNIVLVGGRVPETKLADFGSVRATPQMSQGVITGDVGYLSPEQIVGSKGLDGRSDSFSLGCVLYRCLTNAPIFPDFGMDLIVKMLLHDAPRVSAIRTDVPFALDDLIARLLAKEPAQRPSSATVKEDLERIAISLGA